MGIEFMSLPSLQSIIGTVMSTGIINITHE